MSQVYSFTLDGMTLAGVDGEGCDWAVEMADGWFTGADVRPDSSARMGQDGDWRGTTRRAGRLFTLRGTVQAPNMVALEWASRRMSALLASGGAGTLLGSSDAGDFSAQVWLEGRPQFDPLSDRLATWQVTVASEDPLLYGPRRFEQTGLSSATPGAGLTFPLTFPLDFGVAPGTNPGSVVMPNAGTTSYLPTIRIDGPVTNPVVTLADTGDRVAFAGSVASGQWLDIDCSRRRVLLNGLVSQRIRVSSVGAWLAVPMGGGTVTWTADSAGPSATLSVWGYEGAWL